MLVDCERLLNLIQCLYTFYVLYTLIPKIPSYEPKNIYLLKIDIKSKRHLMMFPIRETFPCIRSICLIHPSHNSYIYTIIPP
jgi:hypothetical protein